MADVQLWLREATYFRFSGGAATESRSEVRKLAGLSQYAGRVLTAAEKRKAARRNLDRYLAERGISMRAAAHMDPGFPPFWSSLYPPNMSLGCLTQTDCRAFQVHLDSGRAEFRAKDEAYK